MTEPVGDDDDEAVAKRIYTTSFTFTDLTIREEYRFKVVTSIKPEGAMSEENRYANNGPGAPNDLQVECGEEGKSVKLNGCSWRWRV